MHQILLMVLICGGTVGFMVVMRKRLNTQYAHLRAGELATRLGMTLVEGDPQHNLATMSVQPATQNVYSAKGFLKQVAVSNLGGTLGEFKLRMTGKPYGSDAELVLYCKQDFEPGVTENVTTTWSDLRLTVHTRCAIPPFELRLRKEMTGLESRAPEQHMPPQSFGDAALDQRFRLESYDPTLPRRLATTLGPLANAIYVHVTGSGSQLSFVMTPATVNATAPSLEQVLHVLAAMAASFEGRALQVAA
jgi:hypothetical protein